VDIISTGVFVLAILWVLSQLVSPVENCGPGRSSFRLCLPPRWCSLCVSLWS